MKYNKKTCAFTGYRPQKLSFGEDENHPDCVKLKSIITNEILSLTDRGYETFLSGMAIGIDMICAEIVLELKKEIPSLRLVAVIPCAMQERQWNECQQKRYLDILARADQKEMITQTEFKQGCMQKRNHYLVEHSDRVLAVWDGQSGGTKTTIHYAQKKNVPVTVIDPTQFLRIELLTKETYEQMTFE